MESWSWEFGPVRGYDKGWNVTFAVARQAEDLKPFARYALVVAPVERRVDDDLTAAPRRIDAGAGLDDLTRAVGNSG